MSLRARRTVNIMQPTSTDIIQTSWIMIIRNAIKMLE